MTCLGVVAVMLFCCFYLFSDYNYLAKWYEGMNNSFYHHEHWRDVFFTIDTKRQGNIFCVAGLIICMILQYHLIRRLKVPGELFKIQFSKRDLLLVIICLVIGTVAWVWGNSLVHQGFDEVFSAVNCASLPPFQTVSYYMLPNNHLLFNLLNGVLFHFADDKVFTGKLISLVCFWGITITVFAWLSDIIENKLLVMATIIIILQFPIWGFGFEARGYELYSLAEWVSFFALMQYIKNDNIQWLYLYIPACIAGYFCIPTFLYFYASFLLFGLFRMIYTRIPDTKFWKVQVVVVLVVLLLYLPAICFSGIHSLTGNMYVSAKIHTLNEFYLKGINSFTGYLNFYTSDFTIDHPFMHWLLFLAPLALFSFHKNRLAVLCGLFYLAMWLSCIILAFIMKVYAIDRAMSGQVSISLALSIYLLYLLLLKLNETFKWPIVAKTALMAFLTGLGISFIIGNKANVSSGLYNNDINSKYDLIMHWGIDSIPRGSTIAFSDECFYWYYQCMLRGDKVSKQMAGDEQYFVRYHSDKFPVSDSSKYVLIKTVFKPGITAVKYELYKRN
jgi:hypothetical protein